MDEALALISGGEGQTIELKTGFAEQNAAFESLGAFANAEGGTVFLGVKPDGSIVGVDIGANTFEIFGNTLRRESEPPLSPKISSMDIEGKTIVAAEVDALPPGDLVHVFNNARIRVGRTNQVMSPAEQRSRLLAGAPARPVVPWPDRAGAPQFTMRPNIHEGRLLCEFYVLHASPAPGGVEVKWLGAGTNIEWTRLEPRSVPRDSTAQKYKMKPTEMMPTPPADEVTFEVRFNLEDGPHGGRWTWPMRQHEQGHWILDSHLGSSVHQPRPEDAW